MASAEDYEFFSKLIASVRENKLLYEKKDPFYFNKLKKENAWAEIAKLTNKTPSECKTKWKLLRERFAREIRKRETPSGSGGCEETEWTLFSEMSFLKNSMKTRRSRGNEFMELEAFNLSSASADDCNASEICFEEISLSTDSTPTPAKKRRTAFEGVCDSFGNALQTLEQRLATCSSTPKTDDCDELFFKTVLSMIKDLPPAVKDDVKTDIFSLIMEKRRQFRS